jgi:hypothetical protein
MCMSWADSLQGIVVAQELYPVRNQTVVLVAPAYRWFYESRSLRTEQDLCSCPVISLLISVLDKAIAIKYGNREQGSNALAGGR